VLAYLSRHTHRVAISNHRLITVDERGITFKVKDCRVDGAGRYTTMTLDVIRLPHPRPSQDGLFANSNRAEMIAAAREPLNLAPSLAERTIETDPTAAQALAQSRLCFPKSKPQDEERVRFRLYRERNLIERFFNKLSTFAPLRPVTTNSPEIPRRSSSGLSALLQQLRTAGRGLSIDMGVQAVAVLGISLTRPRSLRFVVSRALPR
jgi:Putative transposase